MTLVDRYAAELRQAIRELQSRHDLQLRQHDGKIMVTCSCLLRPRTAIGERRIFPAAEAIAEWEAWHRDRGIEVNAHAARPVVD